MYAITLNKKKLKQRDKVSWKIGSVNNKDENKKYKYKLNKWRKTKSRGKIWSSGSIYLSLAVLLIYVLTPEMMNLRHFQTSSPFSFYSYE